MRSLGRLRSVGQEPTDRARSKLGGTGISSVELDSFRKLFPQPTSKFPGNFQGIFSISRPKEALMTLIEGLGTETKIEKVDSFLPEANLENVDLVILAMPVSKIHEKFKKLPFSVDQN